VLTPQTLSSLPVGSVQSLNIAATDGSGSPVAQLPVTVTITGSNPQPLMATTDLNGNAQVTWTGVNTGSDLAQAQARISGPLLVSNQVAATWTPAANLAPVVNAGPNQSITLPANTVRLNGTATDDGQPNATLLISWTKLSGPGFVTFSNANQAVTQATFSASGTYVLQLSANDSQLTSTSTVTVTVASQGNMAPVVNAGVNQTISLPTSSVVLSGSASGNNTLTVAWSQVSGPGNVTFSGPNALYTIATFSATGTYVLRLSASAITLNGAISEPNPPTTSIQWSQVSGGAPVVFSSPNTVSTQASFTVSGVYVLELSVSDSTSSASSTVGVTVMNPGGNQPPTVNAGQNQTLQLPQDTITLNDYATDDGLPSGKLVTQWSQVSGPVSNLANGYDFAQVFVVDRTKVSNTDQQDFPILLVIDLPKSIRSATRPLTPITRATRC